MVGPRDSVIGMDPSPVIQRYLTQMYHRYEVARGPVTFNAVLIQLDDESGHATHIDRIQETLSE
jgi:calcineurin-like phosphoesterase